ELPMRMGADRDRLAAVLDRWPVRHLLGLALCPWSVERCNARPLGKGKAQTLPEGFDTGVGRPVEFERGRREVRDQPDRLRAGAGHVDRLAARLGWRTERTQTDAGPGVRQHDKHKAIISSPPGVEGRLFVGRLAYQNQMISLQKRFHGVSKSTSSVTAATP